MRKLWIGLLATLLLVFAVVPAAYAIDMRTGTDVTVAKGETVSDDLFVTGDSLRVEGNVDGDVFAFGNRVTVLGTINGNLITAGSTVDIQGTVTGAVITAGSRVDVTGRVERSLMAAGSTVDVTSTGAVGHSLVAAGDRITVSGNVGWGMLVGGNRVAISGQVGKELRAYVTNLTINAPAVINGPVAYWSNNKATIDPGARTGEVTYTYVANDNWRQINWTHSWWTPFKVCGFLVVGLLFLALFPALRRIFPALVLEKPWQLPLTGFLSLIAFPVAVIVLMLTVIGIPLSFMTLVLFPALIYFGQILISFSAARLVADRFEPIRGWSWPLLFIVGTLATTLLVKLPAVGWVFGAAFLFYGLGGVLWLIARRNPVA